MSASPPPLRWTFAWRPPPRGRGCRGPLCRSLGMTGGGGGGGHEARDIQRLLRASSGVSLTGPQLSRILVLPADLIWSCAMAFASCPSFAVAFPPSSGSSFDRRDRSPSGAPPLPDGEGCGPADALSGGGCPSPCLAPSEVQQRS